MKRILALIDFSDTTSAILKVAGQLARDLDAHLALVHVAVNNQRLKDDPPRGSSPRLQLARGIRHHRRAAGVLELELRREGTDAEVRIVHGTCRGSSAAQTIFELIKSLTPDLIVMGAHRRTKLGHLFFGSLSDMVLSKANCPVVLVPKNAGRPGL